MKKRVRVYKMGSQTEQPSQEEQIISYITQTLKSPDFDGNTEALKDELTNAGIDEDNIDTYINYVSESNGIEIPAQNTRKKVVDPQIQQAAIDEEKALIAKQNEEAEEAKRQADYNAIYDTDIDMSTTEDTAKYGGAKPSKRSFIKEYTKFAKMAQGGNTPSPGNDDVLNGREGLVSGFQNALKNSAQDAAMRKAAEDRFNAATYGAPQIGAFEEGGIHQDEQDVENPYHHLGIYGNDTRNIFSQNQNIQNDMPGGQFGGFTDSNSGLNKFIGGGDNEIYDEEYQDSDIDFNGEQFAEGGFKMPKRSGRQYAEAVSSPYYTASGERAAAPDLAGRQVSSVNVTDRGIFGRPKAYTINYNNPNEYLPSQGSTSQQANPNASSPEKSTGLNQPANRRQPVADMMMRSGIPGIKQLGARMTRSGAIPEIPQGTQSNAAQAPASNMPYYPPMTARAQRREARDDAKLNRFLGNNDADVFNDPKEVARIQKSNPSYVPFGEATPNENASVPVNGQLDPNVMSALNAGKNNPEVKAKAKLEDKKEEAKAVEQEDEKVDAVINPLLQAESVQAAIDNNTAGGLNKKALNYDYANDPGAVAFQNKYPSFQGQRNEEFWSQQQPQGANKYSAEKAAKMKELGLNPDIYGHHYLYQHPDKFKEYGGPVDYTEYAYGGDVAIPELHKYQMDGQVAFDPNANALSFPGLDDNAIMNENLSFDEPKEAKQQLTPQQELLKYQRGYNQQLSYVDPNVAEENISGIGSTDNPILQQGTSDDYSLKNKDDESGSGFGKKALAIGQGLGFGLKAALDINDRANAKKQENQLLANATSAESNYGVSSIKKRGYYDPNSGKIDPSATGSKINVKYGGGIYAMGGNLEDEDEDIEYMTEDQIKRFLAEGGELEYV